VICEGRGMLRGAGVHGGRGCPGRRWGDWQWRVLSWAQHAGAWNWVGWSRCGSVCGHAESAALGSVVPTVLGSKRLIEGM
jgi:hypothetical protein